jgi:hypothetical protein
VGPTLRACLNYDVGEGATDIDGEALVRGGTDHGHNISGRSERRSGAYLLTVRDTRADCPIPRETQFLADSGH